MNSIPDSYCSICLDYHPDKLSKLRCGHAFGRSCIATWFDSQKPEIPTCPYCRDDARPIHQRLISYVDQGLQSCFGDYGKYVFFSAASALGASSSVLTVTLAGGSMGTAVTLGTYSFIGSVITIWGFEARSDLHVVFSMFGAGGINYALSGVKGVLAFAIGVASPSVISGCSKPSLMNVEFFIGIIQECLWIPALFFSMAYEEQLTSNASFLYEDFINMLSANRR